MGEYLRFDSSLPGDIRELAILIAARAVSQPYEWFAHAPIGQREGLPDDVIERVRARGDLSTLPARYVRPARLVQHVLAFEAIPLALQEEVQRELGMPGLIELVVLCRDILVRHYRQIAGVLSAFDVALPEGARAPF